MLPLNYKSDLMYVRNKQIREYDIASAGYSITISENLITDPKTLKDLRLASKKEKQIILGNYARKDKTFTKSLNKGFQKYMEAFCILNNIPIEKILFIKKDSVTFFDSSIEKVVFKKCIFTKRGQFTSMLRLGNLEFYYNGTTQETLLKGIDLDDHKETLIEEIFKVMSIAESSLPVAVSHIEEIRRNYVNKLLTDKYYKELSPNSGYQLKEQLIEGITVYSSHQLNLSDSDFFDDVDITYNYKNILLPLFEIFTN